MKKILSILIGVVIISSVIPVSAAEDLHIRVSQVDFEGIGRTQNNFSNGSEFLIPGTVQVYNPTSNNISYTHSDLCEFKLSISYQNNASDLEWQPSYPYACPEALSIQEMPPGISNFSAFGSIIFLNFNSTILPDGQYSVVTSVISSSNEISQNLEFWFTMMNGSVIDDRVLDFNIQTESDIPLYILMPFFALLTISIMRKRKI